MVTRIPLLSDVKIAAPCHAAWNLMTKVDGDRVHFCDDCKLNVYNLSAMTQAEAEGLLRKHEGRLCVRYYERPDGTILTRNCPVGAQILRVKLIRQSVSAAFLMLLAALSYAAMQQSSPRSEPTMGQRADMPEITKPPVTPIEAKPLKAKPQTVVQQKGREEMGFIVNWEPPPVKVAPHSNVKQ